MRMEPGAVLWRMEVQGDGRSCMMSHRGECVLGVKPWGGHPPIKAICSQV